MQPVGSIVPAAVRHLLSRGEMSQGKLEFAWKAAVGLAIDRATEISLAGDGTLEVRASDPAWQRELQRTRRVLLERLQGLLGTDAVKAVRVVGRAG